MIIHIGRRSQRLIVHIGRRSQRPVGRNNIMAGRLEGKVAIITGTASGIGRATAVLFAKEGAQVVAADRVENSCKELIDEIEGNGGKAVFVKTDVTINADLKKLVKTAIDLHGRIDILVNNAGIATTFNFIEMDEARDFDDVFNTNVKSCFMLSKEVLPYMLERKKESIVNLGSVASEVGIPMHVSYCASKGAVRQFTRSLAVELAKTGVRVNAVLPGATLSGMIQAGGDFEEMIKAVQPMGRIASPEEIAPAILFLASDEASFCTGTLLTIDGGDTSH